MPTQISKAICLTPPKTQLLFTHEPLTNHKRQLACKSSMSCQQSEWLARPGHPQRYQIAKTAPHLG